MAQDRKYGKVTVEHGDRVHGKPGVPLNESGDEPVFVLRAQDRLSVPTIQRYINLARQVEPTREVPDPFPPEFFEGLDSVIEDFTAWQAQYAEHVKLPD